MRTLASIQIGPPMASTAAFEKDCRMPEEAEADALLAQKVGVLPSGFYDAFVLRDIRVHAVWPSRLLCHFTVTARLLNSGNFLQGA